MEQTIDTAPLRDGPTTYGLVSRLNHWVIAAAMIGMLISGLIMAYGPFERETVAVIWDWHKPIGVLVLGYGLWRVGWRVAQGFPTSASLVSRLQEALSKITHWALLAAVLAMPLSGLAMSIYGGHDVGVFGLVIPGQDKIEWVTNAAGFVHQYAAFALIGLLILHIGGALKHHFIDRDTTLRRMVKRSA
ncbi:cytochrome b [Roseovarius arcticus]|uniref:cytochrome b n=1 Tax=Roseovarius arcticus TaxID=2547404 RepID=UPI001110CEAE|nr:cytochrome b [Roseovarius arcticus]